MRKRNIFLKAIAFCAIILGVSFVNTQKLYAQQYQIYPINVDISGELYQAALNGSPIEAQQTGQNSFVAVQVGNPTWWDPCPCTEQMTPAYAAFLESKANQCCCTVGTCVQGCNCAWYIYIFKPTDPNCYQISYDANYYAY